MYYAQKELFISKHFTSELALATLKKRHANATDQSEHQLTSGILLNPRREMEPLQPCKENLQTESQPAQKTVLTNMIHLCITHTLGRAP